MSRWGKPFSHEWLRDWELRNGKVKTPDRAPVSATDSKPAGRHEAKRANAAQEVYPRFRINVHHRSRRLADSTGRSHKAVVDGIVRAGILPDDRPEFLAAVSETYEQAEVEETIIDVFELFEGQDGDFINQC